MHELGVVEMLLRHVNLSSTAKPNLGAAFDYISLNHFTDLCGSALKLQTMRCGSAWLITSLTQAGVHDDYSPLTGARSVALSSTVTSCN
jgi:hypothetical protein